MPVVGPACVVCESESSDSDIAEVVERHGLPPESPVVDIDDSENDGDVAVVQKVRTPAGGPPLRFQGYRRGRELGRGASGQVFVCRRAGCATGFAVKAVNLRRLQLRPNAEREWLSISREVDILRKLPPHPSIVQLIDTFEERHWFMLVLELVGGGDLFTALTSRPTPRLHEREAAFILRQLCDGLDFLHGQKVIHRDLKLENVLVASQRQQRTLGLVLYRVKITDFGLSKYIGVDGSEAQSTVGSRPYTAPEVLREGSHDLNSDLWCLGVLLYVLLVGRFPYDQTPSQQAELDRIVDRYSGTEECRYILNGLLQMDTSQRLSLAAIFSLDWLQDEDAVARSEHPQKKHRTDSQGIETVKADATKVMLVPSVHETVESARDSPAMVAMEILENSPPDVAVHETIDITAGIASVGNASHGIATPVIASSAAEDGDMTTLGYPQGAWTPFAVEASIQLSEVRSPSALPDEMQVHMVTPDRHAGFILGKQGARIQQIAMDSGSQVWMTSRDGNSDRRVVIIGNYKQCKAAQEFVHEQISIARNSDWRDTEAEVVLFVRAEAAGVVTGRRGFVLNQIQEQSGAKMQLLREEVQGQRPCIVSGTLQSVLRAEKHVFDLVRAVPTEAPSAVSPAVSPAEAPSSVGPASYFL